MNSIQQHIKSGFFVKVEKLSGLRAIRVSYPQISIYNNNVIPSCDKIYESEDDCLTIYKNGKKIRKLDIENYNHRSIILMDIICTCRKRNISEKLILTFDADKFVEEGLVISKLIDIPKSSKEKGVALLLGKMLFNGDYSKEVKQLKLKEQKEIFLEIQKLGGL